MRPPTEGVDELPSAQHAGGHTCSCVSRGALLIPYIVDCCAHTSTHAFLRLCLTAACLSMQLRKVFYKIFQGSAPTVTCTAPQNTVCESSLAASVSAVSETTVGRVPIPSHEQRGRRPNHVRNTSKTSRSRTCPKTCPQLHCDNRLGVQGHWVTQATAGACLWPEHHLEALEACLLCMR